MKAPDSMNVGSSLCWPAEWEPHESTWVSWPHNVESWPGRFEAVEPAFARMVGALLESERVRINVCDEAMEERARGFLHAAGAQGEVLFHHIPTDDAWCRDHGTIFVEARNSVGSRSLIATDWGFNAWGRKYPHGLDALVAGRMSETLCVPRRAGGIIMEGGGIDGNGAGALLTTESCLLTRNSASSRGKIEQALREGLGIREILWLAEGIAGDDTDGHVDDVARFVGPHTVVTAVERDSHDVNFRPLRENRRRLDEMEVAGKLLEVVELPMPPAIYDGGDRLPASYANFYIANSRILVPGYHAPSDERARAILAELFSDREVKIIDCRDLVLGLGAIHCLTQQVPGH